MDIDETVKKIISDNLHRKFEWGEFDCPKLTFMLAEEITGQPIVEQFAGKWNSKASAYKYAQKNGVPMIPVLQSLGAKEVEWGREITGDFYCMKQDLAHQKSWRSAGIVYRQRVAFLTEKAGLCLMPIQDMPQPEIVLRLN